jgi:hypothetical protein
MDPTDSTRLAVELLTVWLDRAPDNADAAAYIAERMAAPDAPEPALFVVGQLNLAERPALILAKQLGATTPEDLRASAHQILQQVSAGLPEQM